MAWGCLLTAWSACSSDLISQTCEPFPHPLLRLCLPAIPALPFYSPSKGHHSGQHAAGRNQDGSGATDEVGQASEKEQRTRQGVWALGVWSNGKHRGSGLRLTLPLHSEPCPALPCSRNDPLTGGSSVIAPETKLGVACGALLLSFFSLAQVWCAVWRC